MKVLVLGISGMLGSTIFRILSQNDEYELFGTARNSKVKKYFSPETHNRILCGLDILNQDALNNIFSTIRPDVVINCIGIIKQHNEANDPLIVLPINAMLPHRLATLCDMISARLIHVSTDCVFSGKKGAYKEVDASDASDLYGKSKYIGEMHDLSHVVTLRTSIIGHELDSNFALVNWFLSQQHQVKGYTKAVFSGVTTIELIRIICNYVIPLPKLYGLYHISSESIDKMSLLKLIAEVYGKKIKIIPDSKININRTLDSTEFKDATGYVQLSWADMIKEMHEYSLRSY